MLKKEKMTDLCSKAPRNRMVAGRLMIRGFYLDKYCETGFLLCGERQHKLAALANDAIDCNLSAVRFCNCMRDGETDSAAARFTRAGRVGAIKPLEDVWQMLRRNAAAGVPNAEDRLIRLMVGFERDAAARGRELQRIV